MTYLGIRQREMLEKMIRFGEGIYPPRWRMNYADHKMLEALREKGLVTLVEHRGESGATQVYRVVEAGQEVRPE